MPARPLPSPDDRSRLITEAERAMLEAYLHLRAEQSTWPAADALMETLFGEGEASDDKFVLAS